MIDTDVVYVNTIDTGKEHLRRSKNPFKTPLQFAKLSFSEIVI